MSDENIHELKANLNVKFKCKDGEELEVKKRLLSLMTDILKHQEGLLTTSILPWKKSYYFSVRDVLIEEVGGENDRLQQN